MMPEKKQLRLWKNSNSGAFLVVDVDKFDVVIADGKCRKIVSLATIVEKSYPYEALKLGDLRKWSADGEPHVFVVVDMDADESGNVICRILNSGKMYNMSLGSLILVSDLLQ